MNYIDSRSYNQYEMWKNLGKPYKWLKGYEAGFNGQQLPQTASLEYQDGYQLGLKDKQKSAVPPLIKDGLSYGHGYPIDRED